MKKRELKKSEGMVDKILLLFFSVLIFPSIFSIGSHYLEKAWDNEEYDLRLKYKGMYNGALVYENKEELHDAWLQIQGQVVVVLNDGRIVKTLLIDDMFAEPSDHIHENRKFYIKRIECQLADECVEKLELELRQLLEENAYPNDAVSVKQIGFVNISAQSKKSDTWLSHYYILEGDSLIKLDDEAGAAKQFGMKLTDQNWNNPIEQEMILGEVKECVLIKLKEDVD